MSSSSLDISTSPSLPLTPLQINTKLYSKYNSSNISYGIKKIDDLIFLETSLYTNKFREFLLYDEETDFLRRFYSSIELPSKLKKILLFYSKYSKIFPNYIIMSGSKYLYKNIQKKQKMINNLQEMKKQERKNRKLCLSISNESNIIGISTMNSIMNVSNSFHKKNVLCLFGMNMNNINGIYDNDDLNKLINDIEKEERRFEKRKVKIKKNVVMLKPFNLLMERSINMNKGNISNNKYKGKYNKCNYIQMSHENSISSPKYTSSLNNNKTRLVLHKKISSQCLFTLNNKFTERNRNNSNNNNNLKKTILTLDINTHLNNNILFRNTTRHNRRRSINQTPSNNSQLNNNNSINNKHFDMKYSSTNLSPVNSVKKLFIEKIYNSSKMKKTKALMFSTGNNSKIITTNTNNVNTLSTNIETEGRNKQLSNSHIKHLTERILDSNICSNNVFKTKICNGNLLRRNLSPCSYMIKQVLKSGVNGNGVKKGNKVGGKEVVGKGIGNRKGKSKKNKKNLIGNK